MKNLLSVIVAAMFAAVTASAFAASHTGAMKDDKGGKMEKSDKMGKKEAKAKGKKKAKKSDKMDKMDKK
jgi:hypothetical protein